jgi:uncharacterized membrane protein
MSARREARSAATRSATAASGAAKPDRVRAAASGAVRPGRVRAAASGAVRPGRLRAAAVVVAVAGLGIAGYLTAVHYAGGSPACAIAHGCEVVQQSRYAELAGVPVALLGLLGYAAILASLVRDGEAARTLTAFLALAGCGFSGWLTYVELARLDAVCSWCVASAVCMTLLAALAVTRLPARRE